MHRLKPASLVHVRIIPVVMCNVFNFRHSFRLITPKLNRKRINTFKFYVASPLHLCFQCCFRNKLDRLACTFRVIIFRTIHDVANWRTANVVDITTHNGKTYRVLIFNFARRRTKQTDKKNNNNHLCPYFNDVYTTNSNGSTTIITTRRLRDKGLMIF